MESRTEPGDKTHRTLDLAEALGRLVAFALPAALALLIVAAVVLIPAADRLAGVRHQHDRLAVKNANDEAHILANDRLIAAIPVEPVLARRLVMRNFAVVPRNELVLPVSQDEPGDLAGLTSPTRRALPVAPDSPILRPASQLRQSSTRTLLLLVAVGLLVAAMLLSGPSARRADELS